MKHVPVFFLLTVFFGIFAVPVFSEELIPFTIIHTNDEHSSLVPSLYVDYKPGEQDPTVGGFARLSGFVNEIRSEKDEPILLFSAGDFLGGAPFAWLALEGMSPELSIMQKIGYDAAVIGNHEYDYGPEQLASYLRDAGYPKAHKHTALLASNTHPPPGHALEEIQFKDRIIIELDNGLHVGVFGLIGKDAVQVAPFSDPVSFSDQKEAAQEQVSYLKEEGAEVIILLSHSGVEEEKVIARHVPEIHLIIGGHCHTLLEDPVLEGDTVIVQAGSLLAYAGLLELSYSRKRDSLIIQNQVNDTPFVKKLDSSVPLDPDIHKEVEGYTHSLNSLIKDMTDSRFTDISEPVLRTEFTLPHRPRLQETPFGNFVTDAMRIMGERVTGEPVDAAFQANGLLRGSIIPGETGTISLYDMLSLVGLGSGPDGRAGYPLVSFYLTGSDVLKVLEISALLSEILGDSYFLQASGIRKTYDPNRAVLFTVPYLDLPLPTGRAVLHAELFTGSGIQTEHDEAYTPLERNDETLYHIISDYYLIPFLPMVGDLVSSLAVTLRDENGEPVESPENTIIYTSDREYKVWESVVEYAASLPVKEGTYPQVPSEYEKYPVRQTQQQTLPLLLYPLGIILITEILTQIIPS